jgi:hypothetical protein
METPRIDFISAQVFYALESKMGENTHIWTERIHANK